MDESNQYLQLQDYASVIIDNLFKLWDFTLLTAVAIVLLIIGIYVFERKDIPT